MTVISNRFSPNCHREGDGEFFIFAQFSTDNDYDIIVRVHPVTVFVVKVKQ